MSFIRRCSLFGASFIGGSTVVFYANLYGVNGLFTRAVPEIGLLPASYEAGEGSGSVEVVVMTTVPGGNSSGLVELSTVDGTARGGRGLRG